MGLGRTFFINEYDNGNKLIVAGDYMGLVEGAVYVSKEMPTYSFDIDSVIVLSDTVCECSFTDTIDHNVDLELIAKRQSDTLEAVKNMEDVDEIKALGAELGLNLDDRKKRLDSVISDFIKAYKEDQGI